MLTQLERVDAELRDANDDLHTANDALGSALEAQRRFVADASHELRTPLTTIRVNAGLLRQYAEVSPEDRSEALAQINGEADRMSRLVNDLLTLARSDVGRRPRCVRRTWAHSWSRPSRRSADSQAARTCGWKSNSRCAPPWTPTPCANSC
ncbi:MAG: histidine kinase dimerization/phospho-acceptor domain-containing protein [Chloroflexia bacterium]